MDLPAKIQNAWFYATTSWGFSNVPRCRWLPAAEEAACHTQPRGMRTFSRAVRSRVRRSEEAGGSNKALEVPCIGRNVCWCSIWCLVYPKNALMYQELPMHWCWVCFCILGSRWLQQVLNKPIQIDHDIVMAAGHQSILQLLYSNSIYPTTATKCSPFLTSWCAYAKWSMYNSSKIGKQVI